MEHLINDILDSSKIEANKLVEILPFDLPQLLAQLRAPLRIRAEQRGLVLAVEVAEGVPARVLGDQLRLRQVLLNLVENAVKFTSAGTITLAARPGSEISGRVRFEITDTGIGIPIDKQQLIFEAFSPADGSMTRRYGGTGLGLSITARLVALMGGSLSLKSEPGRGSCFSVDVPLPEAPHSPSRPVAAPGSAPAVERLRVLVAEDNLVNQLVARRFLERAGHTVVVADDGRAAVAAYLREPFDLILMDLQMPEMDGFQATAEIRRLEVSRGTHTPIVALTARATAGDRELCAAASMDGYASKPIHRESLFAEIAHATLRSASGTATR